MKPSNYKHIDTTCPECKHTEILDDPEHGIIYCTKCGLVLQEPVIFKITQAIQYAKKEEKLIRKTLWRKNGSRFTMKKISIE